MLIVQSTLEKLVPKMSHARWDTWSNVWMKRSTDIVVGVALTVGVAQSSVLKASLLGIAVAGLNAGLMARHLRGRKEWTLPHEQWKQACANVEAKLEHVVHKPYLFRMSALCELSTVLSKEVERSMTNEELRKHRAQADGEWTDGYSAGNMSAMLLTPSALERTHSQFHLNEQDIERWVEASYLDAIFQSLNKDRKGPLSGTIDTLVQLANNNSATMGFYLSRHMVPAAPSSVLKNESIPTWFRQTKWPEHVQLVFDLQGYIAPLHLYHQTEKSAAERTQALDNVDSAMFTVDDERAAPQHAG